MREEGRSQNRRYGPDRQVELRLLEITPALKALEGVVMELDDCAFPNLAKVEIGDDPVIITMEGVESDDEPLDAELGERLIHPTRIVSIVSAETAGFFDGINARLDD